MPAKENIYTRTVTKGKRGMNIDREKYETISVAILSILKQKKEVFFKDLSKEVSKQMKRPFDGSLSWYTTTVKLDMERRKVIKRIKGSSPQILVLAQKKK